MDLLSQEKACLLRGDLEEFNHLVLRYQDLIYSYCFYLCGDRENAVRLTQTVFERAFRERRKFSGPSVRAWMLLLAYCAAPVTIRARPPQSKSGRRLNHIFSNRRNAKSPGEPPKDFKIEWSADHHLLLLIDVLNLDYAEAAFVFNVPAHKIRAWIASARQEICSQVYGTARPTLLTPRP